MSHVQFLRIKATARIVLLAAVLWAISTGSSSAQVQFLQQKRSIIKDVGMGLLEANASRIIYDLNGTWKYREVDTEIWSQVSVPSSWKGNHRIKFRRDFNISSEQFRTKAFQFVALSISNYCEISINGQFIGKHSGLTSFSFNVSPGILKPGQNRIEILVHNELTTKETLPLYEQLWDRANYGGIIHDIAIVARQGVWVQETYLSTTSVGDGRPGEISYTAFLSSGQMSRIIGDTNSNHGDFGRTKVTHYIELLDPITMQVLASSEAQEITVESDRLKEVKIKLGISSIRLWSPETPNTYVLRQRTLKGSMLLDEGYMQVGFKTLETRGSEIFLNGRRIFLKAMTYMEDSPLHGRTLSVDEMERDVLLIKNLGSNAVRLVAGSVHPYFLALCDRYGLLVLLDIPMSFAPKEILNKPGIITSAKNTAREMLARDNWHPSFASIGIGQGIESKREAFSSFLTEISQVIRKQHSVLFHASFRGIPPQMETGLIDIIGVDVMPGNEEIAVSFLKAPDLASYGMPVIVSSLMYPVEIDNYSGYSDPRSIDAQGQFYLNMYRIIRQSRYAGVVIHSFSDWSVARPLMTIDRIHQFTATAGVVDRYRQKRIAYDVLKAAFNGEKPPVLVSGNHEEEHPIGFVVIGILVIFLFALVYNLFRRFRENVVRSFLRPYNFFADVRDQRMLSIFQTSMVGILGALSASLLYANILYHWRMNNYADHMYSQFIHAIWLKKWINYAAWNPFENILITTMVLFLGMLLYTALLRLAGMLSRGKVLLFDAYSVSMWSVLPMIMLAPFGMVLYRVMGVPWLEALAIVLYVGFHLWIVSRIFKGTAIVFDIRPLFFYIGGFVVLAGAGTMWLITLDGNYDFFAYVRYFAELWVAVVGVAA